MASLTLRNVVNRRLTYQEVDDNFFNLNTDLVQAEADILALQSKTGKIVFVTDPEYGATGDGSTNDTDAIQAAIDAVHAAGGGIVFMPRGIYYLEASTLNLDLWNDGVIFNSNTACLVLRDNVRLLGEGTGCVTLQSFDTGYTTIYVADGNNIEMSGFKIDSLFAGTGGGHGVFFLNSTDNPDTPVDNIKITNLHIHNVGSYGIGLQNGIYTNTCLDNLDIRNTGADGIDFKNRSTSSINKGNFLSNIYIKTIGQRLTGSAGIDCRGVCHLTNIVIDDLGKAAFGLAGIRFRTSGLSVSGNPDDWARRSTLTGFYVKSNDPTNTGTVGISSGSSEVTISNGKVEDCYNGVQITGNADGDAERNCISQVIVENSDNRAFQHAIGCVNVRYVGCVAIDSAVGFRNEGNNAVYIGCTGVNCTTNISAAAAAVDTQMTIGCDFSGDFLSFFNTAGNINVQAVGGSTDIDITLSPKGTGVVRMGTYTASSDAPVSGYITIKDHGGVTRKLAVIT